MKILVRLSYLFIIWMFFHYAVTAQDNQQLVINKQWFREAKFGMFIHWGAYSKLGGVYRDSSIQNGAEWIQLHARIPNKDYEKEVCKFNPVDANPEKWMELAKQAGMKYIVFTTKHHDGFCMFTSRYTDYNVVDFTPYKKDVVKMVSDACKKYGLKLGLYYSIVDWHHREFPPVYSQLYNFHGNPNPKADMNKYADYQYNQLKELMTNYGRVDFAWFDAGDGFKNANRFKLIKGDSIVKMIRKYQPGCLINSRIGIDADYGNPEQIIPGAIQDQAFEVCMTMNNNWGYAINDNHWKSSKDLIRKLIEIAHKGGNFLLSVGPDAEGNIPEPSVVCLKDMGKWLSINGESVYGTKNSLWDSPTWGYSTTRFLDNGNAVLYLHVINWPEDNVIRVPDLDNKLIKAFALTAKGKSDIKFTQNSKGTTLDLSGMTADSVATVLGLEVIGQEFKFYKSTPTP